MSFSVNVSCSKCSCNIDEYTDIYCEDCYHEKTEDESIHLYDIEGDELIKEVIWRRTRDYHFAKKLEEELKRN